METGEVEAVLARHPAVRQAVVMPREGPGGKTLAAWLTLHPTDRRSGGGALLRVFFNLFHEKKEAAPSLLSSSTLLL